VIVYNTIFKNYHYNKITNVAKLFYQITIDLTR